MMKKLLCLLVFQALFYACSKDDVKPVSLVPTLSLGDSLNDEQITKLGYKLEREWTSLDNWKDPSAILKTDNSRNVKSDLDMETVRRLGWTDHTLRELYQINGNWPDGIFFNGYRTSHGRGDWYHQTQKAEVVLQNGGVPWQSSIKEAKSGWVVVGRLDETNRTTKDQSSTLWWEEARGIKKSHTVKHSVSFGIEASYGVLFPNFTVRIGYGYEAAKTSENTDVRTDKVQAVVLVRPHRRVQKVVYQRRTTQSRQYKIGFSVLGNVSSNFPRRVDGHFVWFQPASKMLNGKNSVQEGQVVAEFFEYKIESQEFRWVDGKWVKI